MSEHIDFYLFGACGDLAFRKLFPAYFSLEGCDLLPDDLKVYALAWEDIEREVFLDRLKSSLRQSLAGDRWCNAQWAKFAGRIDYLKLDFTVHADYASVKSVVRPERLGIFYLATPPSLYGDICRHLHRAGCLQGQSRIVLEKPIGHDLASCVQVNDLVASYFSERDIYRIDHYLGKETVQNLLVLRFANRFINAQWDHSCIDHIQITVAETVGIEGRWSYYDKVGQLRDMVQNHLMQLLCMVAMEPPNSMTAADIRDEKIKILRALRKVDARTVESCSVRGQYSSGVCQRKAVPSYLDEPGAAAGSSTESYVAIKAFIDNWRWAGVPFYLRTGKRMAAKVTEVVITYKPLPHIIFSEGNEANRIVVRLQPNEGIAMQLLSKEHSLKNRMALANRTLNLDFLGSSGMARIPDAYERLFLDVLRGDQSLFVGREEVEASWEWCDALVAAWAQTGMDVQPYPAGSWGPANGDVLVETDGRQWHR